jgi:S1-C subfamily serine protease
LRLASSTEGVAVVDVADGTVAQSLGFQRGDVLLSVNNTKIAKTRDLEKVAQAGARVWRVIIQRGGQQISATFGG